MLSRKLDVYNAKIHMLSIKMALRYGGWVLGHVYTSIPGSHDTHIFCKICLCNAFQQFQNKMCQAMFQTLLYINSFNLYAKVLHYLHFTNGKTEAQSGNELVQDHTANKWQNLYSNPSYLVLEPIIWSTLLQGLSSFKMILSGVGTICLLQKGRQYIFGGKTNVKIQYSKVTIWIHDSMTIEKGEKNSPIIMSTAIMDHLLNARYWALYVHYLL